MQLPSPRRRASIDQVACRAAGVLFERELDFPAALVCPMSRTNNGSLYAHCDFFLCGCNATDLWPLLCWQCDGLELPAVQLDRGGNTKLFGSTLQGTLLRPPLL
jgi:hypothetical protein